MRTTIPGSRSCGFIPMFIWYVETADMAGFVVEQLSDNRYLHKSPVISN